MYVCQCCGVRVLPGTPARRVVVETRSMQYPKRRDVYPPGPGKKEWGDDPGGVGVEIVREVVACPSCAAGHEPPSNE